MGGSEGVSYHVVRVPIKVSLQQVVHNLERGWRRDRTRTTALAALHVRHPQQLLGVAWDRDGVLQQDR